MDLSNKIGLRLKEIRGGMSQSEFASKLKVSQGTIGRYERGLRSPDADFIALIKEHYSINPNWLILGIGDKFIQNGLNVCEQNKQKSVFLEDQNEKDPSLKEKIHTDENGIHIPQWKNPDPEHYHFVPMAEANLNAGGGSFVLSEETTGRFYAFRKRFLSWIASSPKNVILMKVTGDSMEPKIEDGDTVMIDIGKRQINNGCIYALGYDDIIVIKEIEKLPGDKVCIISKNRKSYPPYEANLNEIRIIGQVIWGDRTFVK